MGAAAALAEALAKSPGPTQADVLEAEALLIKGLKKVGQALGPNHPRTECTAGQLKYVRYILACRF